MKNLHKSIYYRIQNYHNELIEIDFSQLNKFIITVLLKKITQTDVILPIAIGFIVILLSIQSLTQDTVFFPQSNVTAYVTFLLFQFAMALTTVYLLPIVTLMCLNIIFNILSKFNYVKQHLLIPLKLIITISVYYMILVLINRHHFYHIQDQIYLILLWLLLNFTCVNLYISHNKHRKLLKLTKLRFIFFILFILLSINPIGTVLFSVSRATDYLRINQDTILSQANCQELLHNNGEIESTNYIANYSEFYESNSNGCIIHKNVQRIGFASDYVITIRKNLQPINNKLGRTYNIYARMACYNGNCFIDNNIHKNIDNDEYLATISYAKEK